MANTYPMPFSQVVIALSNAWWGLDLLESTHPWHLFQRKIFTCLSNPLLTRRSLHLGLLQCTMNPQRLCFLTNSPGIYEIWGHINQLNKPNLTFRNHDMELLSWLERTHSLTLICSLYVKYLPLMDFSVCLCFYFQTQISVSNSFLNPSNSVL